MNITVDSANAAMNLAGGVLALAAALVSLLTVLLARENPAGAFRSAAVFAVDVVPEIVCLVAVAMYTMGLRRAGLALFAVGYAVIALRFMGRKQPVARFEVFELVFQTGLLVALGSMYFHFRLVGVIEELSKALAK